MSKKLLSEHLRHWRAERPSEWKMDEFIHEALDMERELSIREVYTHVKHCPDCSNEILNLQINHNDRKYYDVTCGNCGVHMVFNIWRWECQAMRVTTATPTEDRYR